MSFGAAEEFSLTQLMPKLCVCVCMCVTWKSIKSSHNHCWKRAWQDHLHESGHQLELINQRKVKKTPATLVCRKPRDPSWRAMKDMESYVLWKGLVSGCYFQCLVNFPVPCLGKSQLTHRAVEIGEFLMSLAKQNVSEGTAIPIESCGFPCELLALSQGGKIHGCVSSLIFSLSRRA